jgi:putative ABC transport system permease protein
VAPLIMAARDNPIHDIDYFTLRMSGNDWPGLLERLGAVIHMIDPGHIIEYHFLDQQLERYYLQDLKRQKLFTMAAGISVFLASLGLFSLAYFNTRRRSREIGIRKVLGASLSQIIFLITKEYLGLIVIAILIAVPVSIMVLDAWLASFAYRVRISMGFLIISGLIPLIIALLTVGYHSFKSASASPVEAISGE